jgi:hypothetical protein
MPRKGVLLLTDVTNAVYSRESTSAIKDFASKNTPFIKASAVVGVDGLRGLVLRAINTMTGRDIKVCKNRFEALDWLAQNG